MTVGLPLQATTGQHKPHPPNPDDMELTPPTPTPVMTPMAAQILNLSELVKQLQANLTATKAMVTSLLACPPQRQRRLLQPTQQRLTTGESQGP